MNNENHFSQRLLNIAAKVKDTIDLKFSFVTGTALPDHIKVSIDPGQQEWKNAETIAQEFKVNLKELQRAFKSCNDDIGINKYLAKKKVEAACILLANGDLRIKEIAAELDYHPDYFSNLFKKQKGVTPHEWQIINGNGRQS